MLTLVKLGWNNRTDTERIDRILAKALVDTKYKMIKGASGFSYAMESGEMSDRIVFVMAMPENGFCPESQELMGFLMDHPNCLEGVIGGVIIDGHSELFTKSIARKLIFSANGAGCTFPGRPLVEATGSLYNFNVISKVRGISNLEAYESGVGDLISKVMEFSPVAVTDPDILVLHASSRSASNSLLLWEMINKTIGDRARVTEISLRNGTVVDCRGCSYETCSYFGEKGDCIYGGVMVDKVYPAIIKCNVLVLVCPNYNDAVSANITAFFNRLTALFRTNDFSAKKVYALVVSGYSGCDIVAEQIIGAMNCNKNFILPPRFALLETANDPESILQCENIGRRAEGMAERILK